MEFSMEDQFAGFLATPQIFAGNDIFEYPLYPTPCGNLLDGLELRQPESSVLGKRMETFFADYLLNFTSEEILLQNRQIIVEKETLGELDFLLKDSISGEISHVELVYKLYLFDPASGTSEIDCLIGPNKRDSLNRKLQRLQKRQFPLLFHPATQELLKKVGVNAADVVQKTCFKALVFLPKHSQQKEFSEINPETLAGYWIRASEFTSETYSESTFLSPRKRYWPIPPEKNLCWYSFEETLNHIQPLLDRHLSPLLWMKTPAGTMERFFIVWW